MMQAEEILDRIYEAGLSPTLWPHLLNDLSTSIGGNGGFLFATRDSYLKGIGAPHQVETVANFMADGWAERDVALQRAIALNHAGFVNDGDLMSDDEIADDPVYRDYYCRHDIRYRAGTIIPMPIGDSISIVLTRSQDNGPVPRETVRYLDTLRPHMARSAMAANRLGFEQARAQTEALQLLGLPAAVLRGYGTLVAANGRFEDLLPSVFQDRSRRISLNDPAADRLLKEALDSLQSIRAVKSIPIKANPERPPLIVHLVPVRGTAHDIFHQARVLLCVTPVDKTVVPTAEVLQGLFDLTPAEARVARGIAEAKSLATLAVSAGVSHETVRSQFKSVLLKTGLSRQQELINLLAGKALPITDGDQAD